MVQSFARYTRECWCERSMQATDRLRLAGLFRGGPTGNNPHRSNIGAKTSVCCNRSDAVLEGLHGVRLHDLPRGLGLHHYHLAEDLTLARLRRRLRAGLDPAQAGHSEDPSLGHLLRSDLRQAADDLHAHGLLQLTLVCQGPM